MKGNAFMNIICEKGGFSFLPMTAEAHSLVNLFQWSMLRSKMLMRITAHEGEKERHKHEWS